MSFISKARIKMQKLRRAARYAVLRAQGQEWLFVMGHMRSGSSLLVHLLNSNSDILGYGETHITYWGRRSLAKLHLHNLERFTQNGVDVEPLRYAMDKILHDHIPNLSVLNVSPLKVIITVRTPDRALPSIIDLNLPSIQQPEDALAYYESTLNRLDRWIDAYDRPYVVVDYDDLVSDPEPILQTITTYLALDEPLTPTYEVMWATGERGIGDSSEVIRAQTITSTNTAYDSTVSRELVMQGRRRYNAFLRCHASCRA